MDWTHANRAHPVTAAKKQIDKKSEAPNSPVADFKKKNLDTDKSRKVGPPTNPLLIHVILDKVLSLAKKKDLRSCRRVCKIWNLKVIPRFRQEFEVYLCTIRHVKTPLYDKQFKDGCKLAGKDRSLWTFLELMRTSICIPFGKYRLDLNGKGNSRSQFFKICGPEMTHVTLENWTLEQEFLRHVVVDSGKDDLCFIIENLNEMFKYTSKLESISFDTPIILSKNSKSKTVIGLKAKPILPALKKVLFNGFQGPRDNIPTFFEDFFARTPNLVDACLTRQLEWHDWDGNFSIWPATIRSMYSAIASTGRLSTIENLTIYFVFPNEFVGQMEKDGIKLKKLRVKCHAINAVPIPPIFEWFVPHRLIELQKDCLHSLTYELHGIGRGPVEFPKMKNLKVLHIHFTNYIQILCTNLTFAQKFPNLEILTYFGGRNGQPDLNLLDGNPCPKLKSIDLLFYDLDIIKFEMMTQVYSSSSLTSLKLDTGYFKYPKLLELIFTNLTNLRVLGLSFTHRDLNLNLDSLFTGISVEECMKIKNTPAFWNFMKGKNKGKKLSELAQLRVSPSIADMKSLARLCLKFSGRGLTNITGYLGLYELGRLRHIHIDFCEFTMACCETLKKELNLQSWVFRQKKGTIVPEYDIPHLGPFGEGANQERTMDILPPYFYPYEETEQHPIFW